MPNSIDFRADQIQTKQIIVTGSGAGTTKLLIYGIEAQGSPVNEGLINTTVFPQTGIGSDVFLFVSGILNRKGIDGDVGTSVFGGDLVISGSLYNGFVTEPGGDYSHAEGSGSRALNPYSHAEGASTICEGPYSHAEGYLTHVYGEASHTEGFGTKTDNNYAHAEGYLTTGSGRASHAEGHSSVAFVDYSHAEGFHTLTQGYYSHTEGYFTKTENTGLYSHAEGYLTTGSGEASHAEGRNTLASGNYSHAEGLTNTANKRSAHAEGEQNLASGIGSHAEGVSNTAQGDYSHAEGSDSIAVGYYSHAGGIFTIASGSGQTVFGSYNKRLNTTSLFAIGNGTGDSDSERKDIFRAESTGELVLSGGIRHHCSYSVGSVGNIEADKGSYLIVADTETFGSTITVYLPKIDSDEDIGLTIKIRQHDINTSTTAVIIMPNSLNPTYRISGFKFDNLTFLALNTNTVGGPNLSGDQAGRSVTLTYVGKIRGATRTWLVTDTSKCASP